MAWVVILATVLLAGTEAHQAEPLVRIPPPPSVSVTAPPRQGPAPIVERPRLVAGPNSDQFARAYPQLAFLLSIQGRVELRCTVDHTGENPACAVINETPAGLNFGAAALSLSAYFRMRPKLVDGAAIDGGEVVVPVSFKLEPSMPSGALTYSDAVLCFALYRARLRAGPDYGDSAAQAERAEVLARRLAASERKVSAGIEKDLDAVRAGDAAALDLLRRDQARIWGAPAKDKCGSIP